MELGWLGAISVGSTCIRQALEYEILPGVPLVVELDEALVSMKRLVCFSIFSCGKQELGYRKRHLGVTA